MQADHKQIYENFNCIICLQLARSAMETKCCGQLMCSICSEDIRKRMSDCPNCRQQLFVKQSVISRRIISTIKINCSQCQQKISASQREQHQITCPKRKINCRYCQKLQRVQQIIDHMQEFHKTQLIKIVIQNNTNPSRIKQNESKSQSRVFQSKMKNAEGNIAHFGQTGKYYCGKRKLIGKCGCCDGRCGPTNGQNCDSCMDLDLKRFNLTKGFLINPQGNVCKFDNDKSNYYCGRNIKNRFCSADAPCRDCTRVRNSVLLGRYSKLV